MASFGDNAEAVGTILLDYWKLLWKKEMSVVKKAFLLLVLT